VAAVNSQLASSPSLKANNSRFPSTEHHQPPCDHTSSHLAEEIIIPPYPYPASLGISSCFLPRDFLIRPRLQWPLLANLPRKSPVFALNLSLRLLPVIASMSLTPTRDSTSSNIHNGGGRGYIVLRRSPKERLWITNDPPFNDRLG
jgi:hypothetical protein